jgi:glycosyltransferase involved in cell wall biosynthesis
VGPGTGYLAEPLEVGDFAGDVALLLDDPAANQAMGARAFDWARRFDWERHLDILERCIVEVARSHEQVAAEAATA